MIGLDTNVLLRAIVESDDEAQTEIAQNYLIQVKAKEKTCFINNIVLCELTWVLKSRYRFQRTAIIELLENLLITDLFEFENKDAIAWAVNQMKEGSADFADYLILKINQQAGCTRTASFDTKLNSHPSCTSLSTEPPV